jgi:hypothetical protein
MRLKPGAPVDGRGDVAHEGQCFVQGRTASRLAASDAAEGMVFCGLSDPETAPAEVITVCLASTLANRQGRAAKHMPKNGEKKRPGSSLAAFPPFLWRALLILVAAGLVFDRLQEHRVVPGHLFTTDVVQVHRIGMALEEERDSDCQDTKQKQQDQ